MASKIGPHQVAANIMRVAVLKPGPDKPVESRTAGIIESIIVLHKYHPTVMDKQRVRAVIHTKRIRVLVASC